MLLILVLLFSVCVQFLPAPFGCYTVSAAGKYLYCSVCGKRITGQYIKADGRIFCSQCCLDKIKPKCCVCGRPATIKTSTGKYYCSEQCLKKSWPVCSNCGRHVPSGIKRGPYGVFLCKACAAKPKCFCCGMPASGKLHDGRYICKTCERTAVMTQEKALTISREVRKLMKDKLGIYTDHELSFALVDQKQLKAKKPVDDGAKELGIFRYEKTVETTKTVKKLNGRKITDVKSEVKSETYSIYYLYGIPENRFREVAAHEIAHDWMQAYYPNISDLKIKEGWAEYVASLVNNLYGRVYMNKRMELNKNKIYGDGYRMIKNYVKKYGMKGLLDLFEQKNKTGN